MMPSVMGLAARFTRERAEREADLQRALVVMQIDRDASRERMVMPVSIVAMRTGDFRGAASREAVAADRRDAHGDVRATAS